MFPDGRYKRYRQKARVELTGALPVACVGKTKAAV